MKPTIFGLAVGLIGSLLLLFGSRAAMLRFVILSSLLGGSAAVVLTGLGGSTIPPVNVALLFLAARSFLPTAGDTPRIGQALSANAALAVFTLYGVIGAWLLPRIFAGAIDVTPLRPESAYIFAVSPLRFTSQNVTVSAYLIGTLLAGICGYVVGRNAGIERVFARTAAMVAIIHALLGFASLAFGQSAAFTFFRNGFYAQLDQSIGGVVRMNGIFAEPSLFAAYGMIWVVLTAELWLRGVDRRWTGPALALLGSALIVSTSTTAYIGLAGYTVALGVRQFAAPRSVPRTRVVLLMVGVALVGAAALLTIAAALPDAWVKITDIIDMTITDKVGSRSGQTRLFWATQGLSAFTATYGLGIGAGSFRSSSLIMAIIGGMGVIGTIAFLAHLARIVALGGRASNDVVSTERGKVADAAGWAAMLMLIPPLISAPSPDPGVIWALIGGLTLALRLPPARPPGDTRHAIVTPWRHSVGARSAADRGGGLGPSGVGVRGLAGG